MTPKEWATRIITELKLSDKDVREFKNILSSKEANELLDGFRDENYRRRPKYLPSKEEEKEIIKGICEGVM